MSVQVYMSAVDRSAAARSAVDVRKSTGRQVDNIHR